eukprot:s7555_g1.t2
MAIVMFACSFGEFTSSEDAEDASHCLMQVQTRNSLLGHQTVAAGRCRNCSFVSPAQLASLTHAESLLQGMSQEARRRAGQVSVGKRIVFTASVPWQLGSHCCITSRPKPIQEASRRKNCSHTIYT